MKPSCGKKSNVTSERKNFYLIYPVKDEKLTVLVVTSEKRDRTFTYIYKQLKNAADQFSRKRRSIIWIYLEDIEPHEWGFLVGDTGLQRMSHRYMLGECRQHVFSMAYSSTARLVSHASGHFQHGGPLMNYNRQGPEYEGLAEMLYG